MKKILIYTALMAFVYITIKGYMLVLNIPEFTNKLLFFIGIGYFYSGAYIEVEERIEKYVNPPPPPKLPTPEEMKELMKQQSRMNNPNVVNSFGYVKLKEEAEKVNHD